MIVLAYGFRPFFLLAGLYAAFSLVVFVAGLAGLPTVSRTLPMELWHGHEMLFGFVTAAAAGFLLTAVPSWTGSPPARGALLALPVVLWLAGRAAMLAVDALPPVVTAVADLPLIPVLLLMVGPRILGSGQRRNYIFLVLLVVLFAANLLFHLEALGVGGKSARFGLTLATYGYILMLSVIAGRVIPFFTTSALQQRGEDAGAQSSPVLEGLSLVAMTAFMAGDLAGLDDTILGVLALATAAILLSRMVHWRSLGTLGDPVLWIIHLGYLWLPAGFALLGVAFLGGAVPVSTGMHALTAGAAGTIVLAMMTRASLGHTGRAMVVSRPIVGAYLLVTLAALVRVAAPLVPAIDYDVSIPVAGGLWATAFAVFTVVYWPVLTGPRFDGKPG